jgi:hypothetical protein
MIIFIPQDENKSSIYRKKLKFSVYYIHLFFLTLQFERSPLKFCVMAEFRKNKVWQDTSENMENMFHCSEKNTFNSENTENEYTHFISSKFLNISFRSI